MPKSDEASAVTIGAPLLVADLTLRNRERYRDISNTSAETVKGESFFLLD